MYLSNGNNWTHQHSDLAKHYKEKLSKARVYTDPIVTEIAEYTKFYPADKSHQDFFRLNPKDKYCTLVVQPKVAEFEKVFSNKVKSSQAVTRSKP